jgi:hypothetical protein
MNRIHVSLDRGTDPRQRVDNHKNANIGWSHLNIFSRTNDPEKVQIYIKAF